MQKGDRGGFHSPFAIRHSLVGTFLYDRARLCNTAYFAASRRLKPAARWRCRIAHGYLEGVWEVLSEPRP